MGIKPETRIPLLISKFELNCVLKGAVVAEHSS